jgi:hypothetical protein
MDLTNVAFMAMLDEHGFAVAQVRPIGAWLIRSSMRRNDALLAGRSARFADRVFGARALARWAPNCIFVARKR